jgi:nitronate monooxygenase
MSLPLVIQGGMGVGVSGWRLAHAVAAGGQLGVVSGTALDTVMVRLLQSGDNDGYIRKALKHFPFPNLAQQILDRFYQTADAATSNATQQEKRRFKLLPLIQANMSSFRKGLLVAANFVEVFLAKAGLLPVTNDLTALQWQVGINYLEKIQLALLPGLYGAMLAGVDVVLIGAGIPDKIPEALDRLARHELATITMDVIDGVEGDGRLLFEPAKLWEDQGLSCPLAPLKRPAFLPIISAATLARALLKKAPTGIDGFIVEGHIAGGHNAPPRGGIQLTPGGEPLYGTRDQIDLKQMSMLGKPFWLAGGYGSSEHLTAARAEGATGIQVGTLFAFCEESGLTPMLKHRFLEKLLGSGECHDHAESPVFTDPLASPTGFPFKVALLSETLSEAELYDNRPRLCDLGYLRRAYRATDGTIHYRCPGEPIDDYIKKGGQLEETQGRKCLCNALVANLGLGQNRAVEDVFYEEVPLLTAGNDIDCVRPLISPQRLSYSARDVLDLLLASREHPKISSNA